MSLRLCSNTACKVPTLHLFHWHLSLLPLHLRPSCFTMPPAVGQHAAAARLCNTARGSESGNVNFNLLSSSRRSLAQSSLLHQDTITQLELHHCSAPGIHWIHSQQGGQNEQNQGCGRQCQPSSPLTQRSQAGQLHHGRGRRQHKLEGNSRRRLARLRGRRQRDVEADLLEQAHVAVLAKVHLQASREPLRSSVPASPATCSPHGDH